jgi:hypothetical protein
MDEETAVETLSTPSSYKCFDEPRLNRRGGGTGLFKENILVTKIAGGKRQSF